MEISMDLKSMLNPVHRLAVGVLLTVLGIIIFAAQDSYGGVTRESCINVTAFFKECKYHSSTSDTGTRNIYLTFEDHDDADIHPSCVTPELRQDLFDLAPGTKMEFLLSEEGGVIYELKVNGQLWLDFNTAKSLIDANVRLIDYLGYVLLPAGALCVLSAVIHLIVRAAKGRKPEEE